MCLLRFELIPLLLLKESFIFRSKFCFPFRYCTPVLRRGMFLKIKATFSKFLSFIYFFLPIILTLLTLMLKEGKNRSHKAARSVFGWGLWCMPAVMLLASTVWPKASVLAALLECNATFCCLFVCVKRLSTSATVLDGLGHVGSSASK